MWPVSGRRSRGPPRWPTQRQRAGHRRDRAQSRPDPGFGYIQPGDAVARRVAQVARFVEKPSARARRRDGGRAATSGTPASSPGAWGTCSTRSRAHTPEVAPALAAHGDDRDAFFAAVRRRWRSTSACWSGARASWCVPGDFGWDDVGTWAALHRVRRTTRRAMRPSDACTRSSARTTWCTPRARRSCCTAWTTSWSSCATA